MERRLAAILAADVAGYTHHTEVNDERSAETLQLYRSLVADIIVAHHGRPFGVAGDAIFAEFPSIVEAIRCAVEIQHEIADRNAGLDEDKRMLLRIGVNLGDVVAEGDGIYGTGVNVAARLQQLAEPGGIVVSKTVYDQVRKIVEMHFQDIGAVRLKNIEEPVRVYRILSMPMPWFRRALTSVRGRRGVRPSALAAILFVAAIAAVAYIADPGALRSTLFRGESILAEQPSIAILPFDDLDPQKDEQYLANGITEELVTALAKFPDLVIIESHHADEGNAKDVRQLGKDLNVRYVVAGSLQKSDQYVRVTAQLIDATTGRQIWADRYDRELKNIFEIRDEIMRSVVGTIMGTKLFDAEVARVSSKSPTSFTAYDNLMRGWYEWKKFTPEGNKAARDYFEQAQKIDPNYARAYAGLAWTYSSDYDLGWSENYDETLRLTLANAEKAVSLDGNDYRSHWVLGWAQMYSRQHEKALASYNHARELNPNDAELLAEMASLLVYSGQPEQAIAQVQEAMRLNPYHEKWYPQYLGWAYEAAGMPKEAVDILEPITDPAKDDSWVLYTLASAYADPKVSRMEDAHKLVAQILTREPDFSITSFKETNPYKTDELAERAADAMRRAGLPE